MYTEQMSQGLSVAANINPQTINNQTVTSGNGINMALFKRALAVLSFGANSGSVTCKFRSSASSGGSFADIANTTITAVTAANKVATMEIRADQMPAGQPWLRIEATEGNSANCVFSAVLLADESPNKPASANDVAAVTQRLVT